MSREALTPSSALPLVYFGWAHAGLALAFLALVLDPALPGGYFLHPRMVAIVHLVTMAWISGSILGAFYVVAPLALGLPFPVRWIDWLTCGAFVAGTAGMAVHFWTGQYGGMVWAGPLVLAAIVRQGLRVARGLRAATALWGVLLHVMLAFANMMAATLLGVGVALDRAYGLYRFPPQTTVFAHVHLAVVGWPVMMVTGLAYRLVPMFLPARMPTGAGLVTSAICLELGLIVIVVSLLAESVWTPLGALLILAGLASFARNMRAAVMQKLPRPPALPRRDWSMWQTHAALAWLLVAAALGAVLTVMTPGPAQIRVAWVYGVAGLAGFLAQIVVGIQGRLVPLYAYYRAMVTLGGQPPSRAANRLPSSRFARPIFLLWTIGVPWLASGLATGHLWSIRLSALVLLAGVTAGAAYLAYLMRTAKSPTS